MAAAALGAAVIVIRSPKLRRLAWQMARQYAMQYIIAMIFRPFPEGVFFGRNIVKAKDTNVIAFAV